MSTGDRKILANMVKSMKTSGHDPLSHLIDRYLMERERPENQDKRLTEWNIKLKPNVRPLGRLSPSTIGGCQRQAAMKFVGITGKKRINPDTELVFEDGHWRHHKWQAITTEMEAILGSDVIQCLAIERRVMLRSLYIAGSLDVHIAIYDRGEMVEWVIDVKGINKYGFADVINTHAPKPTHVKQLLSYMRACKVRRGMLLYENKDDNRYTIFTVIFTKQEWAEVSDWCEETLDYIEYQRLPPMHPDCDHGSYLYEKCPYRKLCYGRFTAAKIERMMYRDFPGKDALWKEGLRLEQEG